MLTEFETRLANVLGARLPVGLRGSVDVAPGRAEARVVLSVRHVELLDEHLFGVRPEVVPGAPTQRRVVRLRCDVGFDIRLLAADQTRATQLAALDRVIYELDEPGFRTGALLRPTDNTDPGFLVHRMFISLSDPPASITLRAEGLFWPTDVPGQTGVAIEQARLRISMQPLRMIPPQPRLTPGGTTIDLVIEFGAIGTMQVERDDVTSLPFGSVVLGVEDAGGRPGAGVLAGGNAGPPGTRVIQVVSGQAAFQYTPPAQAAVDQLVVSLDDGEGGVGTELGRFPLEVR